jgi:APA family basic amino acid/polyamine antiporter
MNVNFIDYAYGYVTTAPALPIWGYPPLLVSFLIDNHVLQMIVVVIFGVWFLGWAGTLWLSSTRMIFAAAFDRVLPEWAARVSGRGVPWTALLLIIVPGVVVSYLYSYVTNFSKLTLDASLVIAVTFFGTSVAATILPWWKADLYNKSPIARYKVAGLPIIAISGAITTIFLGFVIFEWLSNNALYGIGTANTNSIIFLAALYGSAALLYVVARLYRRSQGIDLDAIHAEIPAE